MQNAGGVSLLGAEVTVSSGVQPTMVLTEVEDTKSTSPASVQSVVSPAKVTPKKRGRTAAHSENGDDDDDEKNGDSNNDGPFTPAKNAKTVPKTPKSSTPRKRKAPLKPALKGTLIGRTLEEATEADKKMIEMRQGGSAWKEIRAEMRKLGVNAAESTLPNRFSRLLFNFAVIKEEDTARLFEAKLEIEANFENEKWDLIAQDVERRGGEKYEPGVLKRQYKKLMTQAGAIPPAGVECKDFENDID